MVNQGSPPNMYVDKHGKALSSLNRKSIDSSENKIAIHFNKQRGIVGKSVITEHDGLPKCLKNSDSDMINNINLG